MIASDDFGNVVKTCFFKDLISCKFNHMETRKSISVVLNI